MQDYVYHHALLPKLWFIIPRPLNVLDNINRGSGFYEYKKCRLSQIFKNSSWVTWNCTLKICAVCTCENFTIYETYKLPFTWHATHEEFLKKNYLAFNSGSCHQTGVMQILQMLLKKLARLLTKICGDYFSVSWV